MDDVDADLDAPLAAGTRVGDFVVERRLGAGGSASVYAAVDATGRQRVALKVLHRRCSVDPRAVARFETEVRVVAALGHPNIVEVRGQGDLPDGRRYLVMQLAEGPSLGRLLEERGRLAAGEALPILRGIAAALEAAHAQGVAHRDLKPDNVLLEEGPAGALVPRLADFGLAKLARPEDKPASVTETGTILGTPHYMAPEQARAAGGVDRRADIYAFGILAYRMLVGRLPFTGEDPLDVLLKHRHDTAEAPSRASPELSDALDAPILRMLAKSPDERPATIAEAFAALEQALAQTRSRRGRTPRRLALALGALLLAAVSAVAVASSWTEPTSGGDRAAARTARAAPHAEAPRSTSAPAASGPDRVPHREDETPVGPGEAQAPPRARTRARATAADPESIENPYR